MFTAQRSASSRLDLESGRRSEVPSCVKTHDTADARKAGKSESESTCYLHTSYSMTFAREWTASAAPRTQGELKNFPSFFRAPATTWL